MSAVRKWSLFLRAILVAIGILVLGVCAFRVGIVKDPSLALWPTFGLLGLDKLQGQQPLWKMAPFAAVQVTIWTLLAYLLFSWLDGIRHSSSRRP